MVNVASGLAHVTAPFATAYTMSKRGLVGYSDSLRLEHGDRVTVTTVYPGFIKTKIHEPSAGVGIALEGAVPEEDLSEARAALSPKPIRDLATTRRGTVNYALVRLAPRGVMDRLTRWQAGRLASKGHFDSSEMAADFTAGLRR